jgi:hypothetical protein
MQKYTIVILLLLLAFSCQKGKLDTGIVDVCIEEGKHKSTPYDFEVGHYDIIAHKWTFDKSAQYELCCGDQGDWNKLIGVSAHLYTNHKNSFMCAWRWCSEGYWELGAYYHYNHIVYKSSNNPDIPSLIVYPDEEGKAEVEVHLIVHDDNKTCSLYLVHGESTAFFEHEFEESFNFIRIIQTWFGGSQTASKTICLRRELIEFY